MDHDLHTARGDHRAQNIRPNVPPSCVQVNRNIHIHIIINYYYYDDDDDVMRSCTTIITDERAREREMRENPPMGRALEL